MRLLVRPGATLQGSIPVPGDKSIAHRWLILASTAVGPSRLLGLPASLDVRSTAGTLALLSPLARPGLEVWSKQAAAMAERDRSTWNDPSRMRAGAGSLSALEVEGEGRVALVEPGEPLNCGNSGTTMRLLAGVVASAPVRGELRGDSSLSTRPMERVADPLRRMGAEVETTDGHAPVVIRGGPLLGIVHEPSIPSAQVKSAVLLAGIAADGETSVVEVAPTRDHTERAIDALGGPVRRDGLRVTVERFQHPGIEGRVPGDPSSAAFLMAAAALTGSAIEVIDVGLNPSRLHYLEVMGRMGVEVEVEVDGSQVGEPVGRLRVRSGTRLRSVRVEPEELPLVIDEVPVLAALAAHAPGDSRFLRAGELRRKESDRLEALASGLRALGGHAADEGDDLVVAGGGLAGGSLEAGPDHRIAMALAVGALAADGPTQIRGIEVADVSFPGFERALADLGAGVEAAP